MRARGLTVPLLCSLAIVAGAPAALAGGSSLYSGPDPRPGPDVLYGAPAVAADLVGLGVKPLADATGFRLTRNTLRDVSLVAFSIALGGTPGVLRGFPAGANVRAPADLFLTVHPAGSGMAGDLVDAATARPVGGPAPLVAVDTGHRQIEVRVPHAAWDPGSQLVRLAAGVGLWDKANGRYLLPQAAADAAHPGGAGTAVSPAGFFNVAFRYDEPMPE